MNGCIEREVTVSVSVEAHRHKAKTRGYPLASSLCEQSSPPLDGSLSPMVEKRLEDMTDEDVKNSKFYKDGRFEVPISETAGEDLTLHWINQAFGGLMAAIATRKMQHMEEYDKQSHEKCVQDAHELDEHATCIVELLKADNRRRLLRRWKYLSKNKRKSLASSLKTNTEKNLFLRILKDDPRARMYIKRVPQPQSPLRKNVEVGREWVGSFAVHRAKRAVVSRDSYKLSSAMDRSPLGIIASKLTKTLRIFKGTAEKKRSWQEVVQEIRKKGEILKGRKKMIQAARQKFDQMKKFADKYQSKIKSVTNKDVTVQPKKPLAMPEIDELEQEIEDSEIKEMLREKKKNMTDQDRLMAMPMKLLRDAVKFGLSISGKNTSDVYKKNIKLISPRMFSIVAEDEEEANKTINVLSPSLFSLHNEGRGIERDASLGKIVGSIGGDLTGQNGNYAQRELLNLVVEATGVAEAVEDAERETEKALHQHPFAQRDYLGPEGQPLYFTRENVSRIYGDKETAKIDIIKKLETTYTPEQTKEMNRTGYVIMTNEQKELFYGPGSPHANPEKLAQLKRLSDAQVRTALMGAVHSIAEGKLKFERRQNDFILSPIVNLPIIANPAAASQALVLSPVVLAALVLSPSIFGSVILSPWLFVAVIVAPRILGPLVLSPFVLSPIVLSPVALIPVILSPGVMDPIILSPVLLCPFVLRPFVLSPSVLSPGYVTALVLSPYALSPSVASTGAIISVVASPSWLS